MEVVLAVISCNYLRLTYVYLLLFKIKINNSAFFLKNCPVNRAPSEELAEIYGMSYCSLSIFIRYFRHFISSSSRNRLLRNG